MNKPDKPTEYSFCESVHATGATASCIRPLTEAGRKLGGGIDTPSLCGRVQPPNGWDLAYGITPERIAHPRVTCKRCADLYEEPLI